MNTQVELLVHHQTRKSLDDLFFRRADAKKSVPPIPDTLEPLEIRHARVTNRAFSLLEAAEVLTLPDWSDLMEFHAIGEANAASRLMLMESLCLPEMPAGTFDAVLTTGCFRLPYTPAGHQVEESRFLMAVRRVIRQMTGDERERLYRSAEGLLDTNGLGLTIYRDANGHRLFSPFVGTRDLSSRAS